MFNSIVIEMRALSEGIIKLYPGQKLHAVFLRIVNEVNIELSEKLHENELDKSFTVSSLIGCDIEKENMIYKGKKYYFRVTTFDKQLFSLLTMALFKNKMFNSNVFLEDIEFKITNIIYDLSKSKWAGMFDMEEMLKKEEFSNSVTMKFHTPTLFKTGDTFLRIPEPDKIFGSLLRKFNKYSYYKIDEELFESFKEIKIEQKNIRMRRAKLNKFFIEGFTGEVTFRVENENERLKQAMYILSEFAFYAGVGYKTTMGFGQVSKSMEG